LISFAVVAQQGNLPLGYDYTRQLNRHLDRQESRFHTAVKPYLQSEVEAVLSLDSALGLENKPGFGDNFTQGDIVRVGNDKYNFRLNPLVDFRAGYDLPGKKFLYTAGYGAKLDADISPYFSISATYRGIYEKPASYLADAYTSSGIMTGYYDAEAKDDGAFMSQEITGYLSISPAKYFNIQAGYDRHFFGDGYRSLLLSDNAPANPFVKMTANFWRIKYSYLLNFMQYGRQDELTMDWDWGRKNGAFHYLSIDIAKWMQFGFFEGVVWQYSDSTGKRGIEFNYLNPMVFLRPVEFALGSPDNVILGINLKFKPSDRQIIYGQFVLDDLDIGKARQGRGFYRTKIAVQGGFRGYDLFKIKGLDFFSEFNLVRPYVYAHKTEQQNYAHRNQALAHPLGANFMESITGVNYALKRWHAGLRFQFAKRGVDDGEGKPEGSDIFVSDFLIAPDLASAYENTFLQGVRTNYLNADLRIGYTINPAINLVAEAFWNHRTVKSEFSKQQFSMIGVRLTTDLFNRYTDF
jgi:hypothetical protein